MVKEGGYPIGFIDSVLRNLLRGADFLPVGYRGRPVRDGGATRASAGSATASPAPWSSSRSAAAWPPPLTITPPPTPAELDGFPQRPPLSAWERETLELYLRRVDLTAARREELAQMIAPALAQRMGITVQGSGPVPGAPPPPGRRHAPEPRDDVGLT